MCSFLPLALEPSYGTHDGDTLIHDHFADSQIRSDPRLCGLVVCDFVFVDTGAGLWLVSLSLSLSSWVIGFYGRVLRGT